jgi:hypothetical protein
MLVVLPCSVYAEVEIDTVLGVVKKITIYEEDLHPRENDPAFNAVGGQPPLSEDETILARRILVGTQTQRKLPRAKLG